MVATGETVPLAAGLYFVATPIGNARDITLRALDILASADVLVAEDTRTLRRLMDIHGIPVNGRTVLPYHDHNGAQMRPRLLEAIRDGKSVAYASDAGTPLIADPGFGLGREVAQQGLSITTAPGASSAIAALTLSGLPSDRFVFAGFAPTGAGARESFLKELADITGTVILFESPKRVGKLLSAAAQVFGEEREAAVCRELTKKFEEVRRGSLGELAEAYQNEQPKGEIVVCIAKGEKKVDEADVRVALAARLETMKLKAAANAVAEEFGLSKHDIYQIGLEIQNRD